MLALLQVNAVDTLAFLCVAAGFLVIVASVVFVVKGKAVLGESGAPNQVTWGKIKANLTSAVALFVLGAVMIVLPYWRIQDETTQVALEIARQPQMAVLSGKISGPGSQNVRLLLVEKPDYDQTYGSGSIDWQIPLVAKRKTYSVLYIDGATILAQQSFAVDNAPGSNSPLKITLADIDLQTATPVAQEITPKLEVSDAVLKSHGIN